MKAKATRRTILGAAGIALVAAAVAGAAILMAPPVRTSPTPAATGTSPAYSFATLATPSPTASLGATPTPEPTATPTGRFSGSIEFIGRIEAAGSRRGFWAIGGWTLFRSVDGGVTWRTSALPSAGPVDPDSRPVVVDDLHAWTMRSGWDSVYSADEPDAVVVTLDVYRTVDGGATWQPTRIPGNFAWADLRLLFTDASNGYLFATEGKAERTTIYRTTDGGATWHAQPPIASIGYVFLTASGPDTLWANGAVGGGMCIGCDEPLLRVSRDGGRTWSLVSLPGYAGRKSTDNLGVNAVFFVDERTGIVSLQNVDSKGHAFTLIFKTVDGGRTWSSIRRVAETIMSFQPVDAAHWFATKWDTDAVCIATDNGGATWRVINGTFCDSEAMYIDPKHGIMRLYANDSSQIALYVTSDGGRTWKPAPLPAA